MKGINIYQEERPWGTFRQFTHNSPSTVKIITIKPNEAFSLQSHNKRAEFWHVVKGTGKVELNDEIFDAKIGDEYEVGLEVKHRITAGVDGITILEIAEGDFDESDIIRYQDKYGRA